MPLRGTILPPISSAMHHALIARRVAHDQVFEGAAVAARLAIRCSMLYATLLRFCFYHEPCTACAAQLCCKVPVRRSPKIVLDFLADLCRCIDADECEEKNTACERRTSCMSYDFHTKTPPAAVFICSRHLCRCIDADECEEKNTVLRA